MATKHQKVRIKIPDGYTRADVEAIADDLIDVMVEKAKDGKGIYGKRRKKFPAYTKEYKKRKGSSFVDLTLHDEMLNDIDVLKVGPKTIDIGFENGTKQNAKADGNIRGTYGKSRANSAKARPFLGVTDAELKKILAKYDRFETTRQDNDDD